jgi:hypothetical protein
MAPFRFTRASFQGVARCLPRTRVRPPGRGGVSPEYENSASAIRIGPFSQTGFQLILAAALMRPCSAGVNQSFQTNTATKPATIRATAANRRYSVGVTVYLDVHVPSSIRPQGSLLSTSPEAALAPVRDTWRHPMLADDQATRQKQCCPPISQ